MFTKISKKAQRRLKATLTVAILGGGIFAVLFFLGIPGLAPSLKEVWAANEVPEVCVPKEGANIGVVGNGDVTYEIVSGVTMVHPINPKAYEALPDDLTVEESADLAVYPAGFNCYLTGSAVAEKIEDGGFTYVRFNGIEGWFFEDDELTQSVTIK